MPPIRAGAGARPGTGGGGTGSPDPSFRARLDGSDVMLDVTNPLAGYYLTCSNAIVLEKLDASGFWVEPIDDRPPSFNNPGYYLDNMYVPPSSDEGCDIIACQNFGSRNFVAKAAEYVRTGLVEVNFNGSPVYVPSIETRPLIGQLRVRVQASLHDSRCTVTDEFQSNLEVPAISGVCCPIGNEGCNSTGGRGGWALDFDSCQDFLPAYDTYYRRYLDSRGCSFLAEDLSRCCGCDDAGVDG